MKLRLALSFASCLALSVAGSASVGCDRAKPVAVPTAPAVATGPAATSPKIVYLPTVTVTLGTTPFTVEVADEPGEQETGLMYRTTMPPDRGMIFVFPDVRQRAFWMRNTLIPLDIAYLDADGVVLNVAQMFPLDESGVPSRGPAKYAIELNQGIARRVGLKAGDRVALPAELR